MASSTCFSICCPFEYSLVWSACSILVHIFNGPFIYYWFARVLHIFWTQVFYMHYECLLPVKIPFWKQSQAVDIMSLCSFLNKVLSLPQANQPWVGHEVKQGLWAASQVSRRPWRRKVSSVLKIEIEPLSSHPLLVLWRSPTPIKVRQGTRLLAQK